MIGESKAKRDESQARRLIHVSETMIYDWDFKRELSPGNRWHAFWHLLLNAGLRPSEALALRWEDVSEGCISVRHSLTRGVRGHSWYWKSPKHPKAVEWFRCHMLPRQVLNSTECGKKLKRWLLGLTTTILDSFSPPRTAHRQIYTTSPSGILHPYFPRRFFRESGFTIFDTLTRPTCCRRECP